MKLLDQVHEACLTKHYSLRTEESYARWIERFLRFHRGKRRHNTNPVICGCSSRYQVLCPRFLLIFPQCKICADQQVEFSGVLFSCMLAAVWRTLWLASCASVSRIERAQSLSRHAPATYAAASRTAGCSSCDNAVVRSASMPWNSSTTFVRSERPCRAIIRTVGASSRVRTPSNPAAVS
ncbi:phage integrase N-terminal SAM-like domain-containing protein [Candidatus Bipolaricaulota bacterium]|nr:phage integrase N-terminal SAM-like domain-containing protein [Candidatus Bipolaricaulota bacterium]